MWHPVRTLAALFEKRRTPGSISILCLLAEEVDRNMMVSLGDWNRWDVRFTIGQDEVQIILLDRDIAGEDWRTVLHKFRGQAACIILVSRVVDESLWNEVVCHGGYEIIGKPLQESEVVRAVKMARNWATVRR
jgi:hypothetical protein